MLGRLNMSGEEGFVSVPLERTTIEMGSIPYNENEPVRVSLYREGVEKAVHITIAAKFAKELRRKLEET